jgi:hypothetical protein
MYNVRVERSAGYAGIAFIILTAVSTFLPGIAPSPSASPAEVSAFVGAHHIAWLISGWLAFPAVAFLLWFAVQLSAFLRLVPGEDDGLPMYMLAAAMVATAMILGIVTPQILLGWLLPSQLDSATVRILWGFFNVGSAAIFAPLTIMVFAASHSARRHNSMPQWAIYWGYLAALGCGISSVSIFFTAGFLQMAGMGTLAIGLLPFAIWVILTSLVLIGRPRSSL